MNVPYFPGCTLSTKGAGFDRSGRAAAAALGLTLVELKEWQCCGATFPLATDNSMAFIAPTRLLTQAQKAGGQVTTLCAVCFHVLRRTQYFLEQKPEVLERINHFTEEEYLGNTKVTHFLELLRDKIGWEALALKIKKPLTGLKIAPYYGCLLLRPEKELGMGNPDDPKILHDFIRAVGAQPVDFPSMNECCGSYLLVSKPETTREAATAVIESARKNSSDAIITSCPLCHFNLDYPQRSAQPGNNENGVPIFYFTQLLAMALGLEQASWGIEEHYVDPLPLLQKWMEER